MGEEEWAKIGNKKLGKLGDLERGKFGERGKGIKRNYDKGKLGKRLIVKLVKQTIGKNAGHDMAIVGEPCNADAHAKIPALFMPMLFPLLRNMFNNVCASSLSEKMSSFMFVHA